jgi:hypothetical protein
MNINGYNYNYLGINTDSFLNNSWFTGFIDSDGNFSINTRIPKGRKN